MQISGLFTGGTYLGRRRNQRVPFESSVRIFGIDAEGRPFTRLASTGCPVRRREAGESVADASHQDVAIMPAHRHCDARLLRLRMCRAAEARIVCPNRHFDFVQAALCYLSC